jgi:hypothetical protein
VLWREDSVARVSLPRFRGFVEQATHLSRNVTSRDAVRKRGDFLLLSTICCPNAQRATVSSDVIWLLQHHFGSPNARGATVFPPGNGNQLFLFCCPLREIFCSAKGKKHGGHEAKFWTRGGFIYYSEIKRLNSEFVQRETIWKKASNNLLEFV